MPSLNCADGLDPCNSMAPAWRALKPRSAIATQALLTKLDRIMDFLLAQLNRCPNLSHKSAARRKTRMLRSANGWPRSRRARGKRTRSEALAVDRSRKRRPLGCTEPRPSALQKKADLF